MVDIGLSAQLACIWEATARKPGNVHRYCDFDDVTYLDFVMSAAAIAPVMAGAPQRRVGETVREAVRATRQVTTSNTNLGIILLLAPLASVAPGVGLRAGVGAVLNALDVADARAVYQAIRHAAPGGLGRAEEQDVCAEPTQTLREVMTLAAERDGVARQYATDFGDVFSEGLPALLHGLTTTNTLEGAIIHCHLHLMANFPDSLIARKRGAAESMESAERARHALGSGSRAALRELDDWLRAEGHARNPGTSADLTTASLFAALRTGSIAIPSSIPWSAGADHD